jgi:hypothetical protein
MTKYLCILIFTFPLMSAPFSEKNYKFQKEVKGNFSSERSDGEHVTKLLLDDEVFLNSSYGDLRLLAGEVMIPYIRQSVKIRSRGEEQAEVKQLLKKKEDEKTVYVLELPSLPKDHVYTSINVSQDGLYEANLQVSTGTSPDSMSFSKEVFIYSYSEKPQDKIEIGPTKHRFVRVVSPYSTNLRFESVNFEKIQANAYYSKEIGEVVGERKGDQVVYLVENQARSPFTHLKLYFEEPKFERELKIEEFKNERKWETVFESKVFHAKEDDPDLFLSLGVRVASTYRITVTNGENPPLHLQKLTQLQAKEELVFFLPQAADAGIKLFYGNRYAKNPDFDPNFLPTDQEAKLSLTLSAQEENPNFGFSLVEPPVSGYIANGLFYLGVILLLGIGFKIYKKITTA